MEFTSKNACDAADTSSLSVVGSIKESEHSSPGVLRELQGDITVPLDSSYGHQIDGLGIGGDNLERPTDMETEFITNVKDFPDTLSGIYDVNEYSYIRHWIIKSDAFARRNIFIQSKIIQQVIGKEGIKMKVVEDNDDRTKKCVEITVDDKKQAYALAKVTKLGQDTVMVVKHPLKNLVNGVFYDEDGKLENMKEDEIEEGLKEWNVGFKKIKKLGKQGKMYKATFETEHVPWRIRVGIGTLYKMEKYVPPPIRCFKCQEYGHTIKTCRGNNPHRCQTCAQVYEGGHSYNKCIENKCDSSHCFRICKNPKKCHNCKGQHPSGDKECPEQKFQRDVNFHVHRKNMKRGDAVRYVKNKQDNKTIATVVASNPATHYVEEQKKQENVVMKECATMKEKMTSLEEMFRMFMTNASINNVEGHDAKVIANLEAKMESQQKQINEIKKSHEAEVKKLKTIIERGTDLNDSLRKEKEQLEKEKELLEEKVRQLMINNKKETESNKRDRSKSPQEDDSMTEDTEFLPKSINKNNKKKKENINSNSQPPNISNFKGSVKMRDSSKDNASEDINTTNLVPPNINRTSGTRGQGRNVARSQTSWRN